MKKDLSEIFRHVPVAEKDGWLLDFQGEGEYGINRFLPFGLRTSPYIFDLFAKGLHGMFRNNGMQHVLHYLNDFLMIIAAGGDPAPYNETFNMLCKKLGLSVNATV